MNLYDELVSRLRSVTKPAELPINLCGDAASALESLQKRIEELEAQLADYKAACEQKQELIYGLQAEMKALEAQLPEGMKHCTIRLKVCDEGHATLMADNWVQSPCLHCRVEELEVRLLDRQYKIDALMLEHCPDEMTREQLDNWAKHQRPVDDKTMKDVRPLYTRPQRAGWVLVPEEPTDKMLQAGKVWSGCVNDAREAYKAMIEAAKNETITKGE